MEGDLRAGLRGSPAGLRFPGVSEITVLVNREDLLMELRWPGRGRADLLGQAQTKVNEDVYSHTQATLLREVVDSLEARLQARTTRDRGAGAGA